MRAHLIERVVTGPREYWQEISASQRQMFLYAEDADLWRWQMPSSREFHAGDCRCLLTFVFVNAIYL